MQRLPRFRWSVVAAVVAILCVATRSIHATSDPNCFLSASENVTFTTSAYTVVARRWSEAALVTSGSWAPSTDPQYSSIIIGNDTTVPSFWLHAVPISSSLSNDDVSFVTFFDERFQLCIEFNGLRKFCVPGSSTVPGQFIFQNVYLPSGNWVFRATTMTFLPQQQVISIPSSSTFCCVNVTSPLSAHNASLLQFSPRRNNGMWYQRKSVCAAVGKPMPPITVSAVRLDNTSWIENGGLEPSITLLHESATFRLRIVSGLSSSSGAIADVYGSWSVTVARGQKGEVTFQNVSVAQFLAAPSVVIDVIAVSSGTHLLNTLVVLLVLDRSPRASCALFVPQQRNPPFLSTYFGRWGAPVRVLATMPTISIGLMQSDGSLSDGKGRSFTQPLLVSVDAYDVNGRQLPGLIGGNTAAIVAGGLCTFSGLYVKNISRVIGSMIFLSFRASRTEPSPQATVIGAVSLPLIVNPLVPSSSASATPALIVLDPRNSQFFTDGIVGVNFLNATLPATRLFLIDDASRRVVSSANVNIIIGVSAVECLNDTQLQTVSVQAPSSCSFVNPSGLYVSGVVSRPVDVDGTVTFTDLRVVTANPESQQTVNLKRIIVLSFSVIAVPSNVNAFPYLLGYSLPLPLVILQETAPVTHGRVGFIRGKRLPSLFTDELQPAHCIVGVPLPPIVFALYHPGTTIIDRRNATLFMTSASGATLLHATTVFRYGVAQFPGLVIAASRMPVVRVTFTVWYTDENGIKQRLQDLESGAITILNSSFVARPYALRFSMLSSSYICHEDVVVGVLNNSAIPAFVVDATRSDYLLSGIRQTVRLSAKANANDSVAPDSKMESDSVNCSVRNGQQTITSAFALINGSAVVRISPIAFRQSTVVLQCCLAVAEAPQSCTPIMTLAVGVPARLLYSSALGTVTTVALPQSSDSSIPSSIIGGALLSTNSSIEASLTLYCQDNETTSFKLCTSLSGINSSMSFLQPLRYASDPAKEVSNDIDGIGVLNGNAVSLPMTLGDEDSFFVDGVQAIIFGLSNDGSSNANDLHASTELVGIREILPSLLQVLVLYVDAIDLGESSSLLVEQLASLINIDGARLSLGTVTPASYPLPTANLPRPGVHNLLGTRVELRVLPRLTSSKADTVDRITNQILGVSPSCLQQTALTSAYGGANFIRGLVAEGHAALSAGSTRQLLPTHFCDVSLFESLAESARHCELFLGADRRCLCFTALFRAMGRACVGQRVLVSVCDHMAYCTDAAITDVCSLVQPNVPLQVFFVVGGTILGLAVVLAILKFKSILRFVSQARYRMHENEGNVLSKQSASSVNMFTP